ncbi:hypothetical protein BH20ACT10_BH20ACT10_18960 [soil metagenome]
MPRRKNPVRLSGKERRRLKRLVSRGSAPTREPAHARILLKADEGGDAPQKRLPDTRIADALEISRSTVRRARERLSAEGLEAAIGRRPPKNTKPRKLDGEQEAHLVALACSEPPDGRERWSMRLLAGRFVELECGVEVSRELVRRTLKKAG